VGDVLKGPIDHGFMPTNCFNVSAAQHRAGMACGIFTAAALLEQLTGETL